MTIITQTWKYVYHIKLILLWRKFCLNKLFLLLLNKVTNSNSTKKPLSTAQNSFITPLVKQPVRLLPTILGKKHRTQPHSATLNNFLFCTFYCYLWINLMVELRRQSTFQTSKASRSISALFHLGSRVPSNSPVPHSRTQSC